MEKFKEIKEYLLNNRNVMFEVVNQLNGYDGCLSWLDYHHNDEEFFDEYFHGAEEFKTDVIDRSCRTYSENDDYVRFGFDVYLGDVLESCSFDDMLHEYYSSMDEIVTKVVSNNNVDLTWIDNGLSKIL